MYTLRRWWDHYGLKAGLTGLVLVIAWLLRQTQASIVLEVYQALSRPFQASPDRTVVLEDTYARELEQRLAELESQNQQLQALVNYTEGTPGSEIIAPVIGRSADHWWQQIILGRGSRDGVEVGSVVSGIGGLVGRVTQVTPSTSRVLLISDPTSQVGVTISRSRHMGFIRGQSEDRAVMEFFDKVPDVRPGDLVVTSSFSRLFPSGLPVGQVESINLNKSPAPEAVIELSAPIGYMEWAIITDNTQLSDSDRTQLEEMLNQPSPNENADERQGVTHP